MNLKLLKEMLKSMHDDNVDLHTLNSGLLTSIASSLAVIADSLQKEGVSDGEEKDPTS